METSLKNKFSWFILFCVCCLPLLTVYAGEIPGQGGVDIPVIVNVFGSTDTSSLNDILTTANNILRQADIRLVVDWVNYGIEIGDGDGRLAEAEHEDVLIGSLFELMPPYGPGKGFKINIAEDIFVEEPQLISSSDVFLPIVYLESSVLPEQMGRNLAHEIGFSLGLSDSGDSGNLMFHDGQGTSLNQSQIDVILPSARKIGCERSDLATGFAPDFLDRLPPGALYVPTGRAFGADHTGDVVLFDFSGDNVPFDGGPDALLTRLFVDRADSSGTIDIELVALDLRSANGDTFVDVGFAFNAPPSAPGDILAPHIFDLSDTIVGLNIPGSDSSYELSAGMIDVLGNGEFVPLPDLVPQVVEDEQTGFSRVGFSVPVRVFNDFSPHPLEDALVSGYPIEIYVNVEIFNFDPDTFEFTSTQDFVEGGTLQLDPPPLPVLPPNAMLSGPPDSLSPGFEIRSLKPANPIDFDSLIGDDSRADQRMRALNDLLRGSIPGVEEGRRVDPVVNLYDSGDSGFFNADNGHQDWPYPGIDPFELDMDPFGGDNDNYIGSEIRALIELNEGLNSFSGSTPGGVIVLISDQVIFSDGFESGDTSAWSTPQSVRSKKFRKVDKGISLLANGDGDNTILTDSIFAFVVEEPGLYPLTIRSLTGRDGASLELHELLPDGTRILLGDVANGGSAVFVPEDGGLPPVLPEPPDEGENGLPEGFETGIISQPPWGLSGDENWFVSTEEAHSGTYSAQAGPISDSGSTSLVLEGNFEAGEITFWLKVSSEVVFDFLSFSIDGTVKDEWDGQVDWKQVSFPVENGSHTLKWTYEKDSSASRGRDTTWIDDIAFNPLP
ncbi:MAG: hypothetical protein GY845_06490 [Planctomycetes bacterium]|nr:hypothetical protein [Planctomycetota bacterium]